LAIMANEKKGKSRKEREKERKAREEAEKNAWFLRQKQLREAKTKWVEELILPLGDFTWEQYQEYLEDEDLQEEAAERRKKRDEMVARIFVNRLAMKEEKMRSGFSLGKMLKGISKGWQGLKKDAVKVAADIGEALEPYDVKVDKRVAKSMERIKDADREMEAFLKRRQEVIDALDKDVKAAKIATRKRKVALEVQEATTGFVKKDQDRLEQEIREQSVKKFQEQRQAEVDARLEARRLEIEAQQKREADEIARVKKWRLQHWKKNAVEFRKEAKVRPLQQYSTRSEALTQPSLPTRH
jgi:hypothetical protein